ncbi:GDSL-like Lipase/Acylhydrolase family protein [Tistlia consotensis]|uniref:GDSL-like Lipase/Acylhydrolase family protein n=1 Tax=Tistlia consotensis USBA 355 TaxID=560819 RepID=A0A1Y6CK19_9PROT|nr:SGNH/GDSL hydrolase family protein [Tistlia consotensis]SMF71471.1 GDSL-like Lipase/Acylhydrolase family protein [Tistlia consotensis USBA 355]SNS06613.1 GDSL-like Lipase/Acylhydrolase family protein [Tistlia consotensis]
MNAAGRDRADGGRRSRRARLRGWIVNLLLVVLSIAITCLACEGIARLAIAPRSSGIGLGILDARFHARHPVRGAEPVSAGGPGDRPRILFLGDSFTEGQGVDPAQTFPARVAAALGDGYAVETSARSGADTRDERALLASVLLRSRSPTALVVHQYFGNDIAYLSSGPQVPRPGWLGRQLLALSEVSYLADYLYQPIFLRSFGPAYVKGLFRAYRDDRRLATHLRDLDQLWTTARGAGSAVLFVVFPFLNSHVLEGVPLFELSRQAYIAPLADHFLATCRPGDGLLDVAALIGAQPDAAEMSRWTANAVDPHPSAALHALVAQQIVAFVTGRPDRVVACPRQAPVRLRRSPPASDRGAS